jgi:hypothetical protein
MKDVIVFAAVRNGAFYGLFCGLSGLGGGSLEYRECTGSSSAAKSRDKADMA